MIVRANIRVAVMALLTVCFASPTSQAQEIPKYTFTGAFAYTRIERGNWIGWNISGSKNMNRYLGIAADFGKPASYQTGNVQSIPGMTFLWDRRAYTIMLGPKATLTNKKRIVPFVQLLLGIVRESVNIENHEGQVVIHVSNYNQTGFAMSLGTGADYILKGPLAFRGQFDYTGFYRKATDLSPAYWDKGIRLSAGLTLRLGAVKE